MALEEGANVQSFCLDLSKAYNRSRVIFHPGRGGLHIMQIRIKVNHEPAVWAIECRDRRLTRRATSVRNNHLF